MKTKTRRFALRERTAAAHAVVDAAVGPFDGLPAYRDYLQGLHAFRARVESGLADVAWPDAFGGWRPVLLAGLIREDMADLGMPSPAHIGPPSPSSDASGDLSELMGRLYVLEGSALGARLLLRRAEALGLGAGRGARHLARQADAGIPGGKEGWPAFLELLETLPLDSDRLGIAALATFAAAADAFGRHCHVDA